MTAALEAAWNVGAGLRTPVTVRRTFVHVSAGALVRAESIAGRAGADEAAGRVTAVVRARPRPAVTFVRVRTTGTRRVYLVAGVAETAVRAHRVDAAAVRTCIRHHTTLIQVCVVSTTINIIIVRILSFYFCT